MSSEQKKKKKHSTNLVGSSSIQSNLCFLNKHLILNIFTAFRVKNKEHHTFQKLSILKIVFCLPKLLLLKFWLKHIFGNLKLFYMKCSNYKNRQSNWIFPELFFESFFTILNVPIFSTEKRNDKFQALSIYISTRSQTSYFLSSTCLSSLFIYASIHLFFEKLE